MFKHVQTCSNMFKHVQTCSDIAKHVQTCSNMFRHVQTCSNMFKHVQTCSDMFKPLLFIFSLCLPWRRLDQTICPPGPLCAQPGFAGGLFISSRGAAPQASIEVPSQVATPSTGFRSGNQPSVKEEMSYFGDLKSSRIQRCDD